MLHQLLYTLVKARLVIVATDAVRGFLELVELRGIRHGPNTSIAKVD